MQRRSKGSVGDYKEESHRDYRNEEGRKDFRRDDRGEVNHRGVVGEGRHAARVHTAHHDGRYGDRGDDVRQGGSGRRESGGYDRHDDLKTPSKKEGQTADALCPKRPRKEEKNQSNTEELQQQNRRLKNELEETKEDHSRELKRMKVRAEDTSDDQVKEIRYLKDKLRDKDLEMNKLAQKSILKRNTVIKTENLEERNRKLVIELEEIKLSKNNIDKEKKDAMQELEEVKKELNAKDVDEDYETLLKENEYVDKQLSTVKSLLKKVRSERNGLKKDILEYEEEIEDLKLAVTKLNRKVVVLKHQIDNLQHADSDIGKVEDDEDEEVDTQDVDEEEDIQVKKGNNDEPEVETGDGEENEEGEEDGEMYEQERKVYGETVKNVNTDSKDEHKVDEEGKNEMNKTFQVESPDLFDSIIIHSDDEFPEEHFIINNYEVKNYMDPKSHAGKGMKAPSRYTNGVVKPGVCALNNMVVFIAVGTQKYKNNFNDAPCKLRPHCNIKWKKDDYITRVHVFGSPAHPENNKECWVCVHHGQASRTHVKSQVQTLNKARTEVKGEKVGVQSDKDENEDNKVEVTNDVGDNGEEEEVVAPVLKNDRVMV